MNACILALRGHMEVKDTSNKLSRAWPFWAFKIIEYENEFHVVGRNLFLPLKISQSLQTNQEGGGKGKERSPKGNLQTTHHNNFLGVQVYR